MRRWNGWGSDQVDFPLTRMEKNFILGEAIYWL
jgi:hypothetical protein